MKRLKEYKNTEKMKAYRNRHRSKNYAKGDFRCDKSNKPHYTAAECKLIIEHTFTDRELAKMLGRCVTGIQKKRHKLLKRKKYESTV